MRSLVGMERSPPLIARPGPLLRGAAVFGLATWLAILALLASLPGITLGAWCSALAMAGLFACLLAGQQAAEIRADREGISGRTLFRRLRCPWPGVQRVEVWPFVPGITIFLVATRRGPLVFTSLWRNHGALLETVRARARLD